MSFMIQTPESAATVQRKTTVYSAFKGVDFSVDPSLVDRSRSPYAPNLISDIGGMPEKRLGWRVLTTLESPINGIYGGEIGGSYALIVHGGTKLYRITFSETGELTVEEIKTDINNAKSTGFFMSNYDEEDGVTSRLYILTGAEYLVYDGTEIKNVSDNAYVPRIIIGRSPTGGGVPFEAVNLIGTSRREDFIGNDTDKVFHLSGDKIEKIVKVEVLNSDGETETYTMASGSTIGDTQYKVDLTEGTVTFSKAKPTPVTGTDNVYITYKKTVSGYADRINKCTISTLYGYGGDNRVFLTGNPDYKAYDWYSDVYEPAYFPDTNYGTVGSNDKAVMGYLKLGQYLLIVKEDSSETSTLLQRRAAKENDETVFYVEQGVTGLGAISKYCFCAFIDEPLFLSRRGVMGIYSTNILAERSFKNRSYFVNSALIKEEGLENACACEWNGYYILAVNGHAYILDSKNKAYLKNQSNDSSDYVYECYYWDNIPARVMFERGGELYFGTEDGKLCKFNTDMVKLEGYNDNGEPIKCAWATKNDDDGMSYLYKTMQKRGCSVTIKPFTRSSAKIYISKDGEYEKIIRSANMDIFTFDDFSFERFSFNTNDSPQDIYLKKKVKKYKRMQIIVKNDGLNEGFGIFQITKTFSVGNYAKK